MFSKPLYKLVFFLITLLLPLIGYTQNDLNLSTIDQKKIILTESIDTIKLSDYSILPNSEQLSKQIDYKIDYNNALFIETNNSGLSDSLTIKFRRFTVAFNESKSQLQVYKDPGYDTTAYEIFIMSQGEQSTFDFDQLKIEGNVGRSLNFGNSQNLVVNSNLNLRLSGVVANDVEIVGVLTDRNVPFQPQGDSRQIQELDQVFLQFKKQNHQITMGDYEYRKPESYFLILNKRLQGLNYQGQFSPKKMKISTQFNGAVTRGKYAQNKFVGSEGNQGPYKLYGTNNESYLIILAGTERVFLDGVALERGLDRDYTIDYNSGEITFTSRILITNRSRISVEFEYRDQSYTNTLFHNETNLNSGKLNMRFNLYSQQDSKNRINLTDTSLNTSGFFNSIGDSSEEFFINSANEQPYNKNRIQYRLVRDSLIQGQIYDSIFVYSNSAQEILYNVIFTFVGEGKGDYSIANQNVNGRVYKWNEPLNGVSQGSYIPKLRLTPPGQQQFVGLTTSYQFSEFQKIEIETSYSNKDLNSLSTIGNGDNQGLAAHLKWSNQLFLNQKDSTKNQFLTKLNFERKGANFRAIERYRPVEFSRDWNLATNQTDSLGENYGTLDLAFLPNKKQQIGYTISYFGQDKVYNGIKQIGSYRASMNNYEIDAKIDYLTADETNFKSTFWRPSFLVSKSFAKLNQLKIGVRGDQNQREIVQNQTGNLTPSSIEDRELKFFIETTDSSFMPLRFEIGRHYDKTPLGQNLVDLFEANEISFSSNLRKVKNHQLNWMITYRDLTVLDTTLTTEKDKNSVLGRINYTGHFIKGLIQTGFDYNIGSGRELKREFSYLEVANGEGSYIWNDYNGNGIQEISEFELAPFQDQANYVRVFSNSNEYINADNGQLNQWIVIDPGKLWNPRSSSGIKKFASKINLNSTLIINNKLYEDAPGSRFFPYLFNVGRDGLISSNNRWSNRLIYNKLSNQFRLSYLYNLANGKSQLVSGYEDRNGFEHQLSTDVFFKNKISLNTTFGFLNQSYLSENYSSKTFDFDQYSVQPKLSVIFNNQLRFGLDYKYSNSQNAEVYGDQNATIHASNFDFNWNKQKLFALKGFLNFNAVNYTGDNNDAVAFSMLNGLQNGKNILWNLSFEREVFQALKINLVYDGRRLGENNIINTGRARFTATF